MPDVFDATSPAKKSKGKKKKSVVEHVVETAQEKPKSRTVDEYSKILSEEAPTANPFRAYAAKPVRTYFDTQHHQEEVLLLLRRHPVTQLKWIIVAILLFMAPALFSAVGLLDFLPATYRFVAALGWNLLIIGFVLEAFLSWFYNVNIITDERIIDVDFTSLLFKNVSHAKLDNIEDVTATTSGTLGAIFDYGTVLIQTAAAVTEFEFEDIPHPNRVTTFLNELMVEEEREKLEGRAS